MASITLNFEYALNVSIQANSSSPYTGADIVYFQTSNGNVYEIGPCTGVAGTSITCDIPDEALRPSNGDYIFFGKSPETNTSSLVGYYAEVDMEITSTSKKELFAVNTEMFISSK